MYDDENEDQQKLTALQTHVAALRDAAVNARRSSGIETLWREDEEYYQGIDDLNRGSETYVKPQTGDGGLSLNSTGSLDANRCSAFFNITQPFVDAARARLRDVLLPANDWNFRIRPTPVPDFEEHKEDEDPMLLGPDGSPISVGQVIRERLAESAKRVKHDETQIKDWLVECDYTTEYGKVLDAAALIGTGVLKGPYPRKKSTRKVVEGAIVEVEEIAPASECVSVWDIFPDPNCGDDIHNGAHIFERGYLTARQLRNLIGMPDGGYLDAGIVQVLNEGPNKRNDRENDRKTTDNDRFEIWHYYGELTRKELSLIDDECECPEGEGAEEAVPIVVAMINTTIIKGHVSPLSSGEFPFDFLVWQDQRDTPFGIGVARQGRTAQRMVLASCRALMDNMGLSAIPMTVFLRSALTPEDGTWSMYPGKNWYIKESSGVTDAKAAIQSITIPTLQAELMQIRELGVKIMEDSTGVVSLLRGEQGASSETFGGMQLLHQNASAVLRRVARIADNSLTKPHIKRYYTDWVLMQEGEHGDASIDAIGSTALIERDSQAMQLPNILELSLNPLFGKSPAKVFDEILRAWKFDPGKFDMDEEDEKRMAALQPPPEQEAVAPQVQAAQIRAEVELQKEQMRQETSLLKVREDTDRDTVHVQAQNERAAISQQYLLEKLAIEERLALLKYANDRQISLDKAKADLAKAALKIQSVKELAAMDARAEHLPTPPIEPVGRAEPGKSWQQ